MVARVVVAVAAVAFAGNAAAARSAFKGDVCSLLGARQVTAIHDVSSRCANAKPSTGPGSTIYVANWAGKTPRSPQVQLTVSLYTDQGALQLAKRNLDQGLPGRPEKVTGIGSAAYEATAAFSTGVHFELGKYIVAVTVTGIGKPSWSNASVEDLAKAAAARLA
jgi:hypothetical protein